MVINYLVCKHDVSSRKAGGGLADRRDGRGGVANGASHMTVLQNRKTQIVLTSFFQK